MEAPQPHPEDTLTGDRRRSFWSLVAVQFQGVFSDNALKWLVMFLILGMGMPPAATDELMGQVTALYAVPFIFCSMAGGFLAERFRKRDVAVGVKLLEIVVMLLALTGLANGWLALPMAAVFLMGVHTAMFGPTKYSLLPELLPERWLSWGNGVMELASFVAMILGILAGGWLCQQFGMSPIPGLLLMGLGLLGLGLSFGITRLPAADPAKRFQLNFISELWTQVRGLRSDRTLAVAVGGYAYFNFFSTLAVLVVVRQGSEELAAHGAIHSTDEALLLAAMAIGVGFGAFAAGTLSANKIEFGFVPLGGIGLAFFTALLGRHGLTYETFAWMLGLLGFAGGFFIVPIAATMQHRPAKENKGGVLATANVLAYAGVFLASGIYYLLATVAHLDHPQMFRVCAGLTLLVTLLVIVLAPDALLRLFVWFLTHSIYRLRVTGRFHLPEKGGALLVSNHVSFVDALLLMGSTDRHLRCVMYQGIYELWWVKPIAKAMRAIPISSHQRPRDLIKSLRDASDAIKAGEVVVIFAEGEITRIGQLLPFQRGFERIMKDVDAPIVPVCLGQVWGSIFSFSKGKFFWKLPRYIPYPVTVAYGAPLPAQATPFAVRMAVQELITDAWPTRRQLMLPIHRSLIRFARLHPRRFFAVDALTPPVSFGAALVRTVLLARRLRSLWADQEMVGLLLPPSVGGALVNYAALLMGKVPVNLNYTASAEGLGSCARQCALKTVVTSRAFLEKAKVTAPVNAIFLEDLATPPSFREKWMAILLAALWPAGQLERAVGRTTPSSLDELATIIFSSGSTGDPKGVMLTHYNVVANAEQMGQIFAFHGGDRILGVLPFFHSFGFTATLVTPAVLGVGAIYHLSPLDGRAIGALAQEYGATFLLTTPTFLQVYLRLCEPAQFGSLQFAMTGAEKLPERVATAFEEKFGLRPLEGYGTTECGPAIAINTRDFRAAGFRQVGGKRGTIGHPLPGVSARIVDPDTFQPKGPGEAGLLLVRGPNIMKGYLGRPEKTAEVLRDGWYVTGDIATLDEDGFLQITDRLSRFSKIAGEMVPHVKIEEVLQEISGATEPCFAVTSVPDEKKGERLMVLHTLKEAQLAPVLEKFAAVASLPNLWKPKADQFVYVEKLPYLGTGKLDLRQLRELALARPAA